MALRRRCTAETPPLNPWSLCLATFCVASFCNQHLTCNDANSAHMPIYAHAFPCTKLHERAFAIQSNRLHKSSIGTRINQTKKSTYLHLQEQPYTQVISDVDDTIKSSGGVAVGGVTLGGVDVQYDRGQFYPGVFEFMLQISLHRSSPSSNSSLSRSNQAKHARPAKVAVLTARAEEFKVALELKDTSKLARSFRSAGQRAGIENWGLGPVLYGSVAEWVVQYRKGLRKFTNFERLLEQDPTGKIMQYVYVGDTGELDQEAGETMLREYPEVVKALFLHVVSDQPDPPTPPPKLINGRPVVFFRTYVGAAASATQLGLMTEEGLRRVVQVAKNELIGVPRSSSKWRDLERDLVEAVKTVPALG